MNYSDFSLCYDSTYCQTDICGFSSKQSAYENPHSNRAKHGTEIKEEGESNKRYPQSNPYIVSSLTIETGRVYLSSYIHYDMCKYAAK